MNSSPSNQTFLQLQQLVDTVVDCNAATVAFLLEKDFRVSHAASRMANTAVKEGVSFFSLFSPYERTKIEDRLNSSSETFLGNIVVDDEERLLHFTSSTYQTDDGHYLLLMARDITDSNKVKQQLDSFFEIIQRSQDEIFVFNTKTLRFLFANVAAQKNTGYTFEELSALSPLDLKPKFSKKEFEALLSQVKVAVNQTIRFKTKHRRKDGSMYDADVRLQYITKGNAKFYLAVIADVSEDIIIKKELKQLNKKLEKKVKERTEALENANKELREFSYAVSHDLRAPLRAISGFSKLLEDELDGAGEESLRFLKVIQSSTEQLNEQLESLLTYSRVGFVSLKLSDVTIKEQIQHALNLIIEPDFAEKASISVSCDNNLSVTTDRLLLNRVLENIISNAQKFSRKKKKPIIEIEVFKRSDFVSISIKDNGIGFDMVYSNKLFELFQKLHSNKDYHGTGFGLALAQRIMSKLNGDISAQSVPNKETTFTLRLPIDKR